ncbi:hypothetical protein [Pseudomonas prosekii]|uniref:Uncharacterized protein n=1 Tax=Pseudomonas prosekii TaxID=1148509 RepID=A0A1H1NZI7_9PSED|nr:hypothetical protein [Pseudomonas prosekii]SDS04388.1 hypothetical protein SAMN05216222_0564 [Pseudomonas prosekii]
MTLTKIFISSLCFVCLHANAMDVPIKEGMAFVKARKLLIKDGWQPNPTYTGEYGVENIILRAGFIEIESCTMGVQYCGFNYTKDKTCLGVGTVGEEVKDMKIYSWDFERLEREE